MVLLIVWYCLFSDIKWTRFESSLSSWMLNCGGGGGKMFPYLKRKWLFVCLFAIHLIQFHTLGEVWLSVWLLGDQYSWPRAFSSRGPQDEPWWGSSKSRLLFMGLHASWLSLVKLFPVSFLAIPFLMYWNDDLVLVSTELMFELRTYIFVLLRFSACMLSGTDFLRTKMDWEFGPGSSVHGIPEKEYWRLPFSFSGEFST